MLPLPSKWHPCIAWRNRRALTASRHLPEETPVAITYDGSTQAVMMATPTDLRDNAVGFSVCEGIAASAQDVQDVEIVAWENGVELRIRLPQEAAARLAARRRKIAGPVGCGLCGLDSLVEATRRPPPVASDIRFEATALRRLPPSSTRSKASTKRRARSTRPPFGLRNAVSRSSARTLAATTPSTSCAERWGGPVGTRRLERSS